MITRILPPAEWERVPEHLREPMRHMDPKLVRLVVVEELGDIIGCVVLAHTVIADGVWIAPPHRGRASVARRLLAGTRIVAETEFHGDGLVGHGSTPEMVTILKKMGAVELPQPSLALRFHSLTKDESWA